MAFKEGTNDVRHSLSIRLYRALRDQGASVVGHDLLAVNEALELEPALDGSNDLAYVMRDAEVVVVLNSEPQYAEIDWESIGRTDRPPHVVDTRGILDSSVLVSSGVSFEILGSTD